jgi:molybdopterin/thiamine biosynthesis adenylyltransferase
MGEKRGDGRDETSYKSIFQRNIGLLTPEAQDLLKNSTVSIAGVGGVGGITAETLARMGLGNLKIADIEEFSVTDLNRQTGSFHSTIGKPKVDVLYNLLKDINPEVDIEVYSKGVSTENASEFVCNADIVVDALDYYAPEAKIALHREARKNRQYIFSCPILGFGSLILCFGPESPTIEAFFEYPEEPEKIKTHKIPLEKIMGCRLDYLPNSFFETLKLKEPYGSTSGAAAKISGGVSAIQILKTLIYIEQQKNPERFKEYGKIELTTVPNALRIDGWAQQYCVEVNLERV